MAETEEVRQKAGLAQSRDLFWSLSGKRRKVYGHWKRSQEICEGFRDALHHYVAKAQLELKLATAVGDNKKSFLK